MHTLLLCKTHLTFSLKVHVDLPIVADSVKLFSVALALFIVLIYIFWTYIQLKPCFLYLNSNKDLYKNYVKQRETNLDTTGS